MITKPQVALLKIIDRWDGDLGPDAEEEIGCRGEAFWNVLGALRRHDFIEEGAWDTYIITPKGSAALAEARKP